MDKVSNMNNLAFTGRKGVKSDGYKAMVRRMPADFQKNINELHRFIKEDLPDDMMVMINVHNNRNMNHKTAKSVKFPNDALFNLHIVGDRNSFAFLGNELKSWLHTLRAYCKMIGYIK